MAYNLSERFPPPPKHYNILDPGAYQNTFPPLIRFNDVPFLSKSERRTGSGNKIWTHALYDAYKAPKIPNCTSFMSKVPRFPYEALSKEDIEKILCQCGIENPCECPVEDDVEEIILCQGKVHRQLFKGLTPKSTLGEGLSAPSKKDHGFDVLPNGTKIRNYIKLEEESPPFYDTRVIESTAFYQGCKWSKWSSQRDQKPLEPRPGPADYTVENIPSYEVLCAEKVRALKRKTSKQYRFIEMVQRRDILEGRPGPANYTPNLPKGTDLKWLGPKADRFTTGKYDVKPGPAEYSVKRDFDKVEPPEKSCHMKLAAPSFFGIKAVRFKPRREEGPSPASYDTLHRPTQRFKYCNVAPFGSSSERFKDEIIEDDEDEDSLPENTPKEASDKCLTKEVPTWGFRSKTIRMKPLSKKKFEPSPADLPQPNIEVMRSRQFQYNCPFFSSEGRFQPWFNWIPVHGKEKTPGPAYYCLEKPKCLPAVTCGPMYRSRRFPDTAYRTPAPNEYKVDRGIETILATHNQKLKENLLNKHEFHWSPPKEPKKLSLEAQETVLLNKSIALLDVRDIFEYKKSVNAKPPSPEHTSKGSKLLRCFLQSHEIPMSV